ncbi:hypothetical protein ACS0TY_021316 [Phlomoides rotata]
MDSAISPDDELYISKILNNSQDDETLIPDENFALELQLQEAIVSSFTALRKPDATASTFEAGESSKSRADESPHSLCETCGDIKDNDEMFPIEHCAHDYCKDCISNHVSTQLQKRPTIITCPRADCTSVLEIDTCGEIVRCTWDEVLYKDCSKMKMNRRESAGEGMHKTCRNDSSPSETGESSKTGSERSSSSPSLCEICAERKDEDDMFPLHCVHNFCTDCISKHVSIIIKKRRALVTNTDEAAKISCPVIDCTAVLETDKLRAVLPADVVSMWDDILCESLISPTMKFYCPYKDCSGLLVREGGEGEVIRESECPFCHRLFCAKCNVAWHSGVGCEERERLKEEEEREREAELKFLDLAKKKEWQRCPNCKFYVDKREGCLHMTCRCRFEFCYACGKAWTSTHGGCR